MIAAAVAVPLAVVATAFACANLATLKLNHGGIAPGGEVTAYGRNFNSNAAASTVTLRFNSRNGRVLWEGRPQSSGKLTGSFTAPDVQPWSASPVAAWRWSAVAAVCAARRIRRWPSPPST